MRRLIKRAGYLMAAGLLALAGVVTVTGTASAASTTMAMAARVQSCPFPLQSGPPCVRDTGIIQAGTGALTFCSSDIFTVIYSIQRERGGFVNRNTLNNPNAPGCDGAGGFGGVHTTSTLRACAESTCVNFGTVNLGSQVGVFCEHNGAYLVYVDSLALAGFLPTSRVNVQINPGGC